jgi:hypothetical protein
MSASLAPLHNGHDGQALARNTDAVLAGNELDGADIVVAELGIDFGNELGVGLNLHGLPFKGGLQKRQNTKQGNPKLRAGGYLRCRE